MKNVTIESLDVLDDELGLSVNDDSASVVLLSSGLGVTGSLVENDTKGGFGRDFCSRFVEFAGVVDSFDRSINVSRSYTTRRIISLEFRKRSKRSRENSPNLASSIVLGTAFFSSAEVS